MRGDNSRCLLAWRGLVKGFRAPALPTESLVHGRFVSKIQTGAHRSAQKPPCRLFRNAGHRVYAEDVPIAEYLIFSIVVSFCFTNSIFRLQS